jgi:hypothetical protein
MCEFRVGFGGPDGYLTTGSQVLRPKVGLERELRQGSRTCIPTVRFYVYSIIVVAAFAYCTGT